MCVASLISKQLESCWCRSSVHFILQSIDLEDASRCECFKINHLHAIQFQETKCSNKVLNIQ